jgi:hypothetical protein
MSAETYINLWGVLASLPFVWMMGADPVVMSVQPRSALWEKIFVCTSERVRRQAPCDVRLDEFSPGRLIEGKKTVGDKQIFNWGFPSHRTSVQIRV